MDLRSVQKAGATTCSERFDRVHAANHLAKLGRESDPPRFDVVCVALNEASIGGEAQSVREEHVRQRLSAANPLLQVILFAEP